MNVEGGSLWVVDVSALRDMKRLLGSLRDRADLEALAEGLRDRARCRENAAHGLGPAGSLSAPASCADPGRGRAASPVREARGATGGRGATRSRGTDRGMAPVVASGAVAGDRR